MTYLSKVFGHFKTVLRHKAYVFAECRKRGLFWQGLVHDLSKFSPKEFWESAKYYTGTRSPIKNKKDIDGFSYAWIHHQARNPHHWQHWVDASDGKPIALKIPHKYVVEMACDIFGAAKAYGVGTAQDYYNKHGKYWVLHPETRAELEALLFNDKN